MTLDELALMYDTDKSSKGHGYTLHYERIFDPIRRDTESMCEVGIGNGSSIKMWRDYFSYAIVHGIDQDHYDDCDQGERISTFQCEQTDCPTLMSYLEQKHVEIIVDDASHEQSKTIKTLDCLWAILEPKGWYVIEDMDRQSFPRVIGEWCGNRNHEIRQLLMFSNRDKSSLITFIQKQ